MFTIHKNNVQRDAFVLYLNRTLTDFSQDVKCSNRRGRPSQHLKNIAAYDKIIARELCGLNLPSSNSPQTTLEHLAFTFFEFPTVSPECCQTQWLPAVHMNAYPSDSQRPVGSTHFSTCRLHPLDDRPPGAIPRHWPTLATAVNAAVLDTPDTTHSAVVCPVCTGRNGEQRLPRHNRRRRRSSRRPQRSPIQWLLNKSPSEHNGQWVDIQINKWAQSTVDINPTLAFYERSFSLHFFFEHTDCSEFKAQILKLNYNNNITM